MNKEKSDLWLALPFILGGLFLCIYGSYHLITNCIWQGFIIILFIIALGLFALTFLVLWWFLIVVVHDLLAERGNEAIKRGK